MASMTKLFYGDRDPAWSFGTYYDYSAHNYRHEMVPQYITGYMKPPIEIRCCSKCEDRLRAALSNILGVDSIISTYNHKKLIVTGSADRNIIHYVLKHIQKHHHHFLQHNPFRGLFSRHSHSRYASPYYYGNDDHNWKYTGHGYGHYKQGSLRHASLFDPHRPSHYSHSRYTYY